MILNIDDSEDALIELQQARAAQQVRKRKREQEREEKQANRRIRAQQGNARAGQAAAAAAATSSTAPPGSGGRGGRDGPGVAKPKRGAPAAAPNKGREPTKNVAAPRATPTAAAPQPSVPKAKASTTEKSAVARAPKQQPRPAAEEKPLAPPQPKRPAPQKKQPPPQEKQPAPKQQKQTPQASAPAPVPKAEAEAKEGEVARKEKKRVKAPSAAPPASEETREKFTRLGLVGPLVDVLVKPAANGGLGFLQPTTVQEKAIPAVLAGRDVLVRSQTGSGKTLAFGLPILQLLQNGSKRLSRTDGISALIMSPTRELCFQIAQVLEVVAKPFYWLIVGSLVGGEKRKSEKARLRKGINVLVATPGRLLDHLEHTESLGESLKRGQLRWLVLDEADRLTDPGFVKQIGTVLDWLETNECHSKGSEGGRGLQTVLVSATLTTKVHELASRSLRDPVIIETDDRMALPVVAGDEVEVDPDLADGSDDDVENGGEREGQQLSMPKTLMQHYVLVPSKDRLVVLAAFILRQVKRYKYCVKIVLFVSCRAVVDFLHSIMNKVEWPPRRKGSADKAQNQGLGTRWWKLHGSVEQKERRRAISEFTKAKNGVLICTDVAARGLDLPHVDWIVQYDPPSELSEYVHRVGRTARSGRRGSALLFLTPAEEKYLELLASRNAKLSEMKVQSMYQALCKYAVREDEAVSAAAEGKQRKGGEIGERARRDPDAASGLLQLKLRDLVEGTEESSISKGSLSKPNPRHKLRVQAEEAFLAFVRAYAVHSKETKEIFHPKKLHLGHVAKSFGLKEEPSGVAFSGKKRRQERTKRKQGRLEKNKFERNAKRLTGASEFAS